MAINRLAEDVGCQHSVNEVDAEILIVEVFGEQSRDVDRAYVNRAVQ